MSGPEASRQAELAGKLRLLDQQLRSEMIARGFDPAQDDNVALTAPLAKLYMERETLRAELVTLAGGKLVMTEVERILDQLNRGFAGEAWHGSAVMEILDGLTARQAAARPLNSAHSIWEILLHIAAWERAVRRRLEGDRAQLSPTEDWPAVNDTDETSWTRAKELLRQAHEELCKAVSEMDDSRLDRPIIEGMSSVYVTLHGVIQHSLYHAGQIAILKKASLEEGV